MCKNNKRGLILSSALILLPALLGLILWNQLPAQITTHWGADGAADSSSGKTFAVFGLPLILLLLHWVCIYFTARDKKNQNQHRKVTGMVLWIVPLVSLFSSGLTYATALGKNVNVQLTAMVPLAILFIVMGNYMPKTRQNHTIGIKVTWTLANEENWNRTHRLAGKLWVAGGVLLLFSVFLPVPLFAAVLFLDLVIMAAVPMVYSWWYYKQQAARGEAPKKAVVPLMPGQKTLRRLSIIFVAVILIFVTVLMVSGNIDVAYEDASFTIQASYWQDLTVDYAAVDRVEFYDDIAPSVRTNGFGSPRLSMGSFQNDQLGPYTRYTYNRCDASVVLAVGDKILVLNGRTEADTRAIYEELLTRCA